VQTARGATVWNMRVFAVASICLMVTGWSLCVTAQAPQWQVVNQADNVFYFLASTGWNDFDAERNEEGGYAAGGVLRAKHCA